MTSYQKILFQIEQGIARITLNRPEKRNALDGELISEVRDALRRCAGDDGARVVLVTGSGKDFCSGLDLGALLRTSGAPVIEVLAEARSVADLFLEMRRHVRPIVAAVRGRALAGGCGLATACDIVLAAESAQFGYPEVNIGFVPAIVAATLRRSVSEKRAFELLATGETITARPALELGLVNHVFADGRFDEEVDSYMAKLAAKSASALTLSKMHFYDTDGMAFEPAANAGVQVNALARMTEDFRRGVEGFVKKRRGSQFTP